VAGEPLVLFDGVCNLCHASVNFIIDRDPTSRFRFASMQSEAGRAALARHGLPTPVGDPENMVLIEGDRAYDRSTAALRIARMLSGPVKLLWALILVPAFVRDAVYRFVARNRYRWFGKSDQCRVPSPDLRARFLD